MNAIDLEVLREHGWDDAADEIERLRAERDLWHSRAVSLFWRVPDEVTVGDLQRDAIAALEWVRSQQQSSAQGERS